MIDRWTALRRCGASQGGYVTRRQVIACEVSILGAVADGLIDGVDDELFRLTDTPPGRFDEIARHCARTGGVVSHQSAAAVFGIGDYRPHFLHLSCAIRVPTPGATLAIHHRELLDDHIVDVGAFRVTTPLKTVLDLADSSIAQSVLDSVVADAIAIGRVDAEALDLASAAQSIRAGDRLHCALLARP